MDIYQEPEAPQSTPQGTAEGDRVRLNSVSRQRNSDSAIGASPKYGALAPCEYSLIAPEEPADYPTAA